MDGVARDIESSYDVVFEPETLPCGRKIRNRLVKVAMYEHLATFPGGPPNAHHIQLYSEWAKHEWGMVVTGNVQVAPNHLTLGRDIVLPTGPALSEPSEQDLLPFCRLADAIHGLKDQTNSVQVRNKTLAIMQLNHPGRQSSNFIGGRWPLQPPLAPSALRIGVGSTRTTGFMGELVNKLMFQTPKEMSKTEVQGALNSFVQGAVFASRAGFDGVQVHVAHGYLLAQFLSPKANIRQDAYSHDKALDMIGSLVSKIRTATPKGFVICMKLNAADYAESSSTPSLSEHEQHALQHLREIARWGTVDVIEVSGGDYEKPVFMNTPSDKSPRQAFFSRFSQQALKTLSSIDSLTTDYNRPLILLTGGLRTPALLRSALTSKHADLLGLGRASVLAPDLPDRLRKLQKDPHADETAPFESYPDLRNPAILSYPPFSWMWAAVPKVRLIGAGVGMAWYLVSMRRFADPSPGRRDVRAAGKPDENEQMRPDYTVGGLRSVFWMWLWMPSRTSQISGGTMPRTNYWYRTFWLGFVLLGVLIALLLGLPVQPSGGRLSKH